MRETIKPTQAQPLNKVTKRKAPLRSSARTKGKSLVGKCLVHIGKGGNELYNHAVIYITECTPDKVKGIMVNKLLFGSATIECHHEHDINKSELKNVYEDLYQGGPENPAHGSVLFPKDEGIEGDPYAEVQGDIAISTSFGILQEIIDGVGPNRKIIAMGHCVWHRGELEWEIFNNQWLIIPSNTELLFDTRLDERWAKAMASSGVNMQTFIRRIGLA